MPGGYHVRLTRQARLDLLASREWLLQAGSGSRARARLNRINAAVADLGVAPARWPNIGYRGVRERIVEGYALRYHIDETGRIVTVLRIFGPYQDRPDP
jgi:plasmid stabilization system protein ParE